MPVINSKPYVHLANPRTFITLIISLLSCFLVIHYGFTLHHETILFGLIVSFPLVFSLQASFRRRDRALEYLSRFRASLNVVYRSIVRGRKFTEEGRAETRQLLEKAGHNLASCLRSDACTPEEVYASFDEVFYFIEENRKCLARSTENRVIRYMRDVHECGTYLLSLKRHRTITALRAFSFIFINLFPFMQAAVLYGTLGNTMPQAVIYGASLITAFVLITLYNIQVQLEYPFDQIGYDDIHLEDFAFDPVTKPYPLAPNAGSGDKDADASPSPRAWEEADEDD